MRATYTVLVAALTLVALGPGLAAAVPAPDHAEAPDEPGPPDHVDLPEQAGGPDDAAENASAGDELPENASAGDVELPENATRALEEAGPPENLSEHVDENASEAVESAGPPEDAGAPDHAGPSASALDHVELPDVVADVVPF